MATSPLCIRSDGNAVVMENLTRSRSKRVGEVFDAFISYSSADAAFVQDLVGRLERRGVRIWLDRAEIKPGDYNRERINKGILDSRYMLAVLSPSSLNSRWVQHEVDAAMIRELNERNVQLIPLLIGAIDENDLPPDLRGKNYVDFRVKAKELPEFERLIALLNPEKARRQEFLEYVRSGMPDRANAVSALQEVACNYHDQTIETAAISALQDIGTPEAAVALAHRLLNPWGMASIKKSIRVLRAMPHGRGIPIIGATFFWDSRFYNEKLAILREQLDERGSALDDDLARRTLPDGSIPTVHLLAALTESTPLEISAGVTFGSQFWWKPQLARLWMMHEARPFWMPEYPADRVSEARAYLDETIPGLTEFLERNLSYHGPDSRVSGAA